MPRPCKTCTHKDHEKIDFEILEGRPPTEIAERHGLSYTTVKRHRDNGHISRDLVRASKIRKIVYSDSLLEKLLHVQLEVMQILDSARESKDDKTALNAARTINNLMLTQGKVVGEIRDQEVLLQVNPMFVQFKNEILAVLAQFPKARTALEPVLTSEHTKMDFRDVTPAVQELIEQTVGLVDHELDPGSHPDAPQGRHTAGAPENDQHRKAKKQKQVDDSRKAQALLPTRR